MQYSGLVYKAGLTCHSSRPLSATLQASAEFYVRLEASEIEVMAVEHKQRIQENVSTDTTQSRNASSPPNLETERVKYAITLIGAALFLLHLFFPGVAVDAVALSLLLLAMLPWLIPYLQNYLESGKLFGAEFKFLQRKVAVQEKQIRNQQEVIQLIYEALKRNLTQHEYRHLIDLEQGNPSSDYQHSYFLEMEMVRLCQHGYVKETYQESTWKMKDKGTTRFDLKEFYQITDEGKEYLKLLQELQTVIAADSPSV